MVLFNDSSIHFRFSTTPDDSGDELYKPNRKDINTSDSEITSERDTSSEAESVTNIRLVKPKEKHHDKIWKRKGKSNKKNLGKKRRTVHAAQSKHVEKEHKITIIQRRLLR
jgi:hypothetical protein